MKQKTITLIIAAALLAGLLSACSSSTYPPNTRQMTASGTGTVYVTPDIAYVYIGVETKDASVGTALTRNNAQAQAVAAALEELGVAAEDIQTSAFNVYPSPEYSPEGEIIRTNYVVNNTVYVTVRNLSSLGQVLDAVVRSGANTINGVEFDITNKDEAISQARQLAIEDARKTADALSTAAGVKLGRLLSLYSYTSGGGTRATFEGKGYGGGMDSGAPISSGQLLIIVNADLTYEIK